MRWKIRGPQQLLSRPGIERVARHRAFWITTISIPIKLHILNDQILITVVWFDLRVIGVATCNISSEMIDLSCLSIHREVSEITTNPEDGAR